MSRSDAHLHAGCQYAIKRYPSELREKFNALVEQLCISAITLGELHYGAELASGRRRITMAENVVTARIGEAARQIHLSRLRAWAATQTKWFAKRTG